MEKQPSQMSYLDHLKRHPEQVEDVKGEYKKSKRRVGDWNKKFTNLNHKSYA